MSTNYQMPGQKETFLKKDFQKSCIN